MQHAHLARRGRLRCCEDKVSKTADSVLPLPRDYLFLPLTPFLTYTYYFSYTSLK